MTLHVKDAGVWKPTKDLWVKDAGVWKPVRRGFVKDAGVWKQHFQDEVVATISSHTAQANAQNYFSTADWQNPLLNKRLVITGGAHIWSYTQGVPALNLGTGRSGNLYLDIVSGYVLGHNGSRNSGVGGTAIKVNQNLCWISNAGGIYGGGGGGGVGGQGGPGYYSSPYTHYEGPAYSVGNYNYALNFANKYDLRWAGSVVATNVAGTEYTTGGWTYYRGANQGSYDQFAIGRYQTRYNYPTTSGGAGGTGGQGTGYNSGLGNMYEGGFGGAAGGTNAGTGGTGGNGGSWGATGSTGATGSSGNNGGGSGGAAGGAAGYYIDGYGHLNGFSNTGTVLGRVQ